MLRLFNFILILLFYNTSFSQEDIIQKANNYISTDYSELLFVSIENQKMYHIKEGAIVKKYIISSSEYGTGSEAGSNKTPLGLHKVKEKYGDEITNKRKNDWKSFLWTISLPYILMKQKAKLMT